MVGLGIGIEKFGLKACDTEDRRQIELQELFGPAASSLPIEPPKPAVGEEALFEMAVARFIGPP